MACLSRSAFNESRHFLKWDPPACRMFWTFQTGSWRLSSVWAVSHPSTRPESLVTRSAPAGHPGRSCSRMKWSGWFRMWTWWGLCQDSSTSRQTGAEWEAGWGLGRQARPLQRHSQGSNQRCRLTINLCLSYFSFFKTGYSGNVHSAPSIKQYQPASKLGRADPYSI